MRALKYYVDTSVWNFVLEEGRPEHQRATEQFLRRIRVPDALVISEVVLQEIQRAPQARQAALRTVIARYRPAVIPVSEEAEALADRYVRARLIPARYRNDALHLAVAVIEDCDAVVSWNFEHMVKLKTRLGVNGLNTMLGYHQIEIVSPEEVAAP